MKKTNDSSIIDCIKYACGGVGSNVAMYLAIGYLTFFYTDIFGISALTVSGLMLVARIIDAVTDPLMGMLGDRTKTKMGRYRPYITFGAPLLAISMIAMFSTPNLSDSEKVIYAYVTYIFYSLMSTVVNIPYHAVTPYMTSNQNKRTLLVNLKQAASLPANLLVMVAGLPIVGLLGNDSMAWTKFATLCGLVVIVSFWLCSWGAKNADTAEIIRQKQTMKLTDQLKCIFKNKPLLMLLIAFSTDAFAGAAASAVNVHYFAYVLKRMDLVAVLASVTLVTSFLAYMIIPKFANLLGKKKLYMICTVVIMIPYTVCFLSPYNVPLIMVMMAIAQFLATFTATIGWAMLPDCVEYGEWKQGGRAAGTVSASLTFSNKVGMALGGSLAAMILAATGYVANGEQGPAVISAITAMKFLFPVFGYICSLISMKFYCITPEFFNKMMADIKSR